MEIPILPGVTHRYVDAGGLAVHVAEAGDPDAPPVMLLHGWPQHWWMWRGVIPQLAPHHRVICPDLRGHGWTTAPRGGYDKEQFATDMLAVLDALEVESTCLVGHDWGGWAGFIACLRAPERVDRFLALNVGHPWPSRDPRGLRHLWRFWYMVVLATPGLGPGLLRRRPELVRKNLVREAAGRPVYTERDLELFAARLQEPDRARASSLVYRTFLLRELLPLSAGRYNGRRLTVPGRLLFGVEDSAIHPSMLDGLDDHADDFPVELVQDCGHFIAEERPHLVAERALALFAAAR
jgi:pimeloyl-ACP methyl ester carboxylesterase